MLPEQEEHLFNLHWLHEQLLDAKYRKGAAEHGNNLLSMTPIELNHEALMENIDQFVFLATQRMKLLELKNSWKNYPHTSTTAPQPGVSVSNL